MELQLKPDSAPAAKESRRDEIERMRREEIARISYVIEAKEGNTANAEDWTKYGLKSNQENLDLLERDPIQYFQEVIKSQDLLATLLPESFESEEKVQATKAIKEQAMEAIKDIDAVHTKYDQMHGDIQ